MGRQLNSLEEMLRRMMYLVYVASIMFFSVALVVSIARRGWRDMVVASGAFILMGSVRYVGYRWLDFERLFQSFPTGCMLDQIPEPVRVEVELLVREFHASRTDWIRRVEIRRRLIELEEAQPEIIEAYAEDLNRVLAA